MQRPGTSTKKDRPSTKSPFNRVLNRREKLLADVDPARTTCRARLHGHSLTNDVLETDNRRVLDRNRAHCYSAGCGLVAPEKPSGSRLR
jgi:hypothetical protein